jgi:glycosyltransferase involved in cell wall biosynthesis
VAKDGLQERVVFLPRVPFGRLMTYIASADVGAIFYDDRESSGYFMCNPDKLSVMAACGTPFVASDYPNLEALTYKHGLGVCCDARDPAQIAAAIRSLGEEGVSEERRRRIRRAFEASLCLEVQGVKLREALDQVLAAGRR